MLKREKNTKKSKRLFQGRARSGKRMDFLEHVEELRRRIFWAGFCLILGALAAYVFADEIIVFLTSTVTELVFIKPYEAFLVKVRVALFTGFLLSLPVTFYHLWAFLAGALTRREKTNLLIFLPLSVAMFLLGVFFAYLVIVPVSMRFFLNQGIPVLTPMISISAYLSFFIWMLLVFGLMFELPLVVFFLSRFGLVDPAALKKQRRLGVVLVFIAAALLTPPDVFSQIMLALPLWVLLEISIFIAGLARRHNT
ncbi:twin-arginine translocase subunit TatC [candidate division FCPU426 bacterium]|nr:twin-arginine translocase subunit TatC [candidate division FCPU426 bacterium]